MVAAFDRAHGDGIGDQPGFEPGLYDEEASDLAQHCQSLSRSRASGGFPLFSA
jgi:hypothetical protein